MSLPLPANLIHIDADLYRVRPSEIVIEDDSFHNPRTLVSETGVQPKGFSAQDFAALRNSIKNEGLRNPPVVWNDNGKLKLISGERRLRSILKLIKDDEIVRNPENGEAVKASVLYETIQCRIGEHNKVTAYREAFASNETSVGIGDPSAVHFISHLRNENYTDEEILTITGKSPAWLKDTDNIIGLDEETYEAFLNEEISRSTAISLAKISDVKERNDLLATAKQVAEIRKKGAIAELRQETFSLQRKADLAAAEAVVAEQVGDEAAAEKARETASKLQAKVMQKRGEVEDAVDSGITVNKADLEISKRKRPGANVDDGSGPLTRSKLAKFYYEPACSLVDGVNKDGDPLPDSHVAFYKVVKFLLEQIEKGNKNIVDVCERYHKIK